MAVMTQLSPDNDDDELRSVTFFIHRGTRRVASEECGFCHGRPF